MTKKRTELNRKNIMQSHDKLNDSLEISRYTQIIKYE